MNLTGCSSVLALFLLSILALLGVRSPLAAQSLGNTSTPTYEPTRLSRAKPGELHGHIAFVSNRTGDYQIFVMNADGSDVHQLTNDAAVNWEPSWSPDGKSILYTAEEDGYRQIFRMNADGSRPIRLTNNSADQSSPVWSPDGKYIAFVSNRDSHRQIYVMNADGSSQKRLTNDQADDRALSWSPDGSLIAFDSTRGQKDPLGAQIWVMRADGSDLQKLTEGPLSVAPAWSPDGKHIAFVGARDYPHSIFLMNADGSSITTVPSSFVVDTAPSWSPDGKYIAVMHYENLASPRNSEIYVLPVDRSERIKVTDDPADDLLPSWGP